MPSSRQIEVRGAREIAAEFALDAGRLEVACVELTTENAYELRRRIQQNAMTGFHGPNQGHIPGTGPGPNVVTGHYVESWQVELHGVGAEVYTEAPQSDRLEYGFFGADAIGRHYQQPAYPHIAPAVEEVSDRLERQLDGVVASMFRGLAGGPVFSG